MTKAKTVDPEKDGVNEYIKNAPEELRGRLNSIRKMIKENAPNALEKISYGMPYYGYKGRLVYFAYFKNHIGFYAMPPVVGKLKEELKGYKTAMATIQFPHTQKLPLNLIKKLVKAGVKNNEEKDRVLI